MPTDFDQVNNRRNSGSLKWNVSEGVLPMWVADMDFQTAPAIKKAIQERASTGIYGYTEPSEDWYNAYISFFKDTHGFEIRKEWLLFCLGVVPTISSSVRKLTSIGDYVVVTPPVYNIFYNSIVNNGRVPLEVPLINEDNHYSIDFKGLKEAFSNPKTTLFILCNPANPVGRIWTKEELTEIGILAKKYNVIVLSDEIHGEIVEPHKSYVPFLSVNEMNKEVGFAAISVTKAFNLAGIQTSAIVIPNPEIRAKVNRQINTDEVAEGNVFSYIAAISALNEGREWLKELNAYLFNNRKIAERFIAERLPELSFSKGEATYLLWIDCRKITAHSKELEEFLLTHVKLYLSSGEVYGKTGDGYLRINLACPKATLLEGLKRLEKGIKAFERK